MTLVDFIDIGLMFYEGVTQTEDPQYNDLRDQGKISKQLFNNQKNMLHMAVQELNVDLVERLLKGEEFKLSINAVDDLNMSALMICCVLEPSPWTWTSHKEIFYLLLNGVSSKPVKKRGRLLTKLLTIFNNDIKIDLKDARNSTALSLSMFRKNLFFAKELLNRHASVVSHYPDTSMLQYFALIPSEVPDSGLPPWASDEAEYKLLHTEVMYLLLSHKFDVKLSFEESGMTALIFTMISYNASLFKYLMQIDSLDPELMEVEQLMRKRPASVFTVESLINQPLNPLYGISTCVTTPGKNCIAKSRLWMFDVLLDKGADVNRSSEYFLLSPVQILLQSYGSLEGLSLDPKIFWRFVERGVDLSFQPPDLNLFGLVIPSRSVFHTAVDSCQPEMLEYIITAQAIDVGKEDLKNGLMFNVLELYQVYGVALDIVGFSGIRSELSDLLRVNLKKCIEIIKVLVKFGAKLEQNHRPPYDETLQGIEQVHKFSYLFNLIAFQLRPAELTAFRYRLQLVLLCSIIDFGADVNYFRSGGASLLLMVAHKGDITCIRKLVAKGADLDFSYNLTACSRSKVHRLINYETCEGFMESTGRPAFISTLVCDLCQEYIKPDESVILCEDFSACDTSICEKCCLFVQHKPDEAERTETEVMAVSRRRTGNFNVINFLHFVHTPVGRNLVHSPSDIDLMMAAGLNDLRLVDAVLTQNSWGKLGNLSFNLKDLLA